jgi:SAM-dependent methyltransferase
VTDGPLTHEPLEATLRRLKEERDRADAEYNAALTALDQVALHPVETPHPPAPYDEQQVTPLNQAVDVLVTPAALPGLKGRLSAFVWRLIAPTLQKQATLNSMLVDHVNRNVAVHRSTRDAVAGTIDALQRHLADLQQFRARLMLYLQHITPYADTKDRDSAGQALVLNSVLNGLADDHAKRAESLAAREQRFEARVSALTAAHDELRSLLGVSQQASLTMKRELERLLTTTRGTAAGTPTTPPPVAAASPTAFAPALDAYKYVGFENQFRGSREAISARLESYLPYFDGAADVLDVGCGRGEFLALLRARGIRGRGLDLNHEMVEVCRAAGLEVAEADVVSYLGSVPDASLGGLFAAQVVEHLQPGYLLRFLELAHHKLRPGAPIVLETLNPACWVAFFDSFIRDITHVWPLHPETLRYLVLASGFTRTRIEYRSPVPEHDKLQTAAAADGATADLVETFNGNVEKLNARIFTFLDYAIVGTNA